MHDSLASVLLEMCHKRKQYVQWLLHLSWCTVLQDSVFNVSEQNAAWKSEPPVSTASVSYQQWTFVWKRCFSYVNSFNFQLI